jgi:multiple sugar transport system substrate-binding protein
MVKKTILAAVVSLGLAAGLVGCASGTPASTGPVTLKFWTAFTGGDRPGYEQLVKDFNASQTHVKVVFSAESGDTLGQRLPSAIRTSAGPDIATLDSTTLEQFAKTKSIIPITQTGDGDSKINTGKFAPALVDLYTFDKKLYGVPANFATLSLYYNKALFAKAGIAGPPKTVKEFQDDAKKLTAGDVSGLVLADHATIPMWPLLQWMSGGAVVDSKGCSVLDTTKGVSSLQQWADLVVKSKISPVGLSGADADSVFSAGKAAMEMNGPWAAPSFKSAGIDLGIAAIPVGVDGPVTLGNSGPLAISAKSAHPKEAQEFLAYYTGKAAQLKFSLAQGFPSFRTDLSSDPKLAADPVVSVFTGQVAGARFYPGKVENANKVDAEGYTPLIQSITRGDAVKDAAAKASTAIDGFTGCTK